MCTTGKAAYYMPPVALLAEGVDRNAGNRPGLRVMNVALLAEGVDRNIDQTSGRITGEVALLAEGVDRNIALSALGSGHT